VVAGRAQAWRAPDRADLEVALGGAAMPLLGASYDAGAARVVDVPAWARPVLAAGDVRAAARAAFAVEPTRPVVRTMARCLAPGPTGTPGFGVLALAVVGAGVLSPDALARVLDAPRADHPTAELPDRSTLVACARVAVAWGPHRTERVLTEAAARADGVDRVVRTARYHRELQAQLPARLPNDLDGLHDRLRARIATAAEGTAAVAPLPARRRAEPRPHPIHAAPPARAQVTEATPLSVDARVRALGGQRTEGLEWAVPRTVGDLHRWGGILANCLADFGAAAAEGRATILGLLRGDQLRYALELTPDGTIRQLVGPANRPAERWVRVAAVGALGRAGIIDPSRPANAVWLRE
ncbi:MAG: PcfJ domain-containing protein, partial [Acidimicrobiales bacterium]|nr:PcfJ domain-containing protein [Acidimicrobiales bacterium]